MDLSNKVVAITGAGGVLMREFAFAMAECGARVALLDINEQAAKEVAAKIGKNALAIKTNCLDKQSIIAAKKEINEKWGSVNFLVNGAGGNNPKATCDNEYMTPDLPEETKSFFDLDESGLKFVFDLNITSAFLVTQVFAADMIKTGGDIINISSMNAFRPLTKIPAYSAAKAGISNFTQWLAVHFAPCNIRVNAIAPDAPNGKNSCGNSHEKIRRAKRAYRSVVVSCRPQRKRLYHRRNSARGRRIQRVQRRLTAHLIDKRAT